MNEKQIRLLTILATVLLALVGIITLVEPPAEEAEDEEKWRTLYPSASSDTIESLEITRVKHRWQLAREAAGWQATQGGHRSGPRLIGWCRMGDGRRGM